jgi:hypothetical protein
MNKPCRKCGTEFKPGPCQLRKSDYVCRACSYVIERDRRERAGKRIVSTKQTRAYQAVQYALKRGRLIRSPCEICKTEPVEAHHDDYSKPLDVRWLCRQHHAIHHVTQRLGDTQ